MLKINAIRVFYRGISLLYPKLPISGDLCHASHMHLMDSTLLFLFPNPKLPSEDLHQCYAHIPEVALSY